MQMAEPTCLMRSFSQPSESSRDFNQGDPARCLGESISFGRYMTEPLAWEKWSTFSSNRYLEEAEKFSKPGSVAKMKAYFEAYYKSIASRKRAAKEAESSRASDLECKSVVQHPSCSDSDTSLEADSAYEKHSNEVDCHLESNSSLAAASISPEKEEDVSDTLLGNDSASEKPNNEGDCNLVSTSSFTTSTTIPPEKEEDDTLEDTGLTTAVVSLDNTVRLEVHCSDDLEISAQLKAKPSHDLENYVQLESQPSYELEKSVCATEVESFKELDHLQKFNSKIKKKSQDSNTGKSSCSKPPISLKMELSKKGDDQERQNKKIKKLPDSNSRISSPYCKPSKISTSSSSDPTKEGCATPRIKKLAKDTINLRAFSSTSLHKTIKSGPRDDVIKKSSRPVLKSLIENPFTPSAKITKDKSTPLQTPNRASVAGKPKHTSATPQPEIGRRQATPSRSLSRGRARDPPEPQLPSSSHQATPSRSLSRGRARDPELQLPSLNNMKPSSSCGLKARATITFSPFNFRTEERAARRKEFFLKQQEKASEKIQQLEKPKERVNTARKLLHTIGLKAISATDSNTKSSKQETCTLPQPRTLKKSDTLKMKFGKNDLLHDHSTSRLKKIRHENDSPNIL